MDTVTGQQQWDDALARVLAYFARLEIGGEEHRVKMALRILARARAGITAGEIPLERAMTEARTELEQWFALALAGSSVPVERHVPFGLVALKVTNAVERWPDAVLAGPPPPDLQAAFRAVSLPVSPDLMLSSMTSREMDYGAVETIAQETWHQFAWAPLLRAAAVWTAVFFGVLFLYEKFFQP